MYRLSNQRVGKYQWQLHSLCSDDVRVLPIIPNPRAVFITAYAIIHNDTVFIIVRDRDGVMAYEIEGTRLIDLASGATIDHIHSDSCEIIDQYKIDDDGVAHFLIVTSRAYVKVRITGGKLVYTLTGHNVSIVIKSICPYDEVLGRFYIISRNVDYRVSVNWLNDEFKSVKNAVMNDMLYHSTIDYAVNGDVLHITTTSRTVHTYDLRTGDIITTYESEDYPPQTSCLYLSIISEKVIAICAHWGGVTIMKYLHWPSGVAYSAVEGHFCHYN